MREHEWLMGEPTAEEWEELLRPEPAAERQKAQPRNQSTAATPLVRAANDDGSPSSRVAGR